MLNLIVDTEGKPYLVLKLCTSKMASGINQIKFACIGETIKNTFLNKAVMEHWVADNRRSSVLR